ncbi:MAG: hypothetical protein ACT4NY_33660 [Pseudonocardiales bacterium]
MDKEAGTSESVASGAIIESIGVVHGVSTGIASYTTPGSAFIYKGEPSATELGMLRFDLTSGDLKQLHGIVTKMMDRYDKLDERDEKAVQEHVDKVVKRIREDKLAVPLRIDLSALDHDYSTETKSPRGFGRTSKFVRLLRRLAPRRTSGNPS